MADELGAATVRRATNGQLGEALDAGDPAAPCRMGSGSRTPARRGRARANRILGRSEGIADHMMSLAEARRR